VDSSILDRLDVFISSTSTDLAAYRLAARDIVLGLDWHPVAQEYFGAHHLPTVAACREFVARSHVVILILAFRRGEVPSPEAGGDGVLSFTAHEIADAKRLGKPILAFYAEDTWPGKLWEAHDEGRAWVESFRKGVNRPAVFFGWEGDEYGPYKLERFKSLVRQELLRFVLELMRKGELGAPGPRAVAKTPAADLRVPAPPPLLPEEPYPLLAPYKHPRTFGGRDGEVETLSTLLASDRMVLLLHSPSGAGKSSLLLAGLAPRLREQGVPVSLERRPCDPGLAQRLVDDLLQLPAGAIVRDADFRGFADHVRRAREFAGRPPVLILDQFEDVLKRDGGRREATLARLGPLIAATARRLPGQQDAACKWVLAYRHEYHGEIVEWLQDVLAESRRADEKIDVADLPYDLSAEAERSHAWPVPVLGKPAPGGATGSAALAPFLDAIVKPLALLREPGVPLYPIRFAGDGAGRLAAAFARARELRPEAPLVPELQVVLAYLLERGQRVHGENVIGVPDDAAELDVLIDAALDDHVRRVLKGDAFTRRDAQQTREGRTRALLVLWRLADAEGRRGEGVGEGDLVRALGDGGHAILERLASPSVRLVLREEREARYVLSHDRLAEVVTRLVLDPVLRRELELDLDEDLVALSQIVGQRAKLFHAGDRAAVGLDKETFDRIERSAGVLIWDSDQRAWWEECVSLFKVVEVLRGDSQQVFRALVRFAGEHDVSEHLLAFGDDELCKLFAEGAWPREGLDPVAPADVLDVLSRVSVKLLRWRSVLGAVCAALEELAARHPQLRARALASRSDSVARFLARYGVAPADRAEDERLNPRVPIPGGSFMMGSPEGEGLDAERPQHRVTLSAFTIQRCPVTNREYRRFDPSHAQKAPDDHPAVGINWYEAMAYAAWLGGSLPTEAQWEFVARGEKERKYPWGNADPTDRHANFSMKQGNTSPVGSYPDGASPEGLLDLAGNVWEWCRDWGARYSAEPQDDPIGPPKGENRTLRGGSYRYGAANLRGSNRHVNAPMHRRGRYGFRVVWGSVEEED